MIQYLLKNGADMNHISADHGTPLHYAAYMYLKEAAQLLLDAGTDSNMVVDSLTPADLAKIQGNMELYELLVAKSALSNQ